MSYLNNTILVSPKNITSDSNITVIFYADRGNQAFKDWLIISCLASVQTQWNYLKITLSVYKYQP
jgi:hypothetical protein